MKLWKNRIFKYALGAVILAFALVGVAFVGLRLAVSFKLTDSAGIIDNQASIFWQTGNNSVHTQTDLFTVKNFCVFSTLLEQYPSLNQTLATFSTKNPLDWEKSLALLDSNAKNNQNYQENLAICLDKNKDRRITSTDFTSVAQDNNNPLAWANTGEWQTFKEAVQKDKIVLARIEKETGIQARLLVSILTAEQLRLFYSDRALFEKVFSAFKILGSQSQFSWGIMGLKPETAIAIEENLASTTSPFYLGPSFEKSLAFSTNDIGQERFARITDEHNHYYGYLYSALYLKQITTEWQKSGFDISSRPEILATLYNIGFANSKPKTDPQVGGSELDIAGQKYSFGRLAYEFYYSGELLTDFPY